MASAGAKPWYREFWLWFVLAPVIATVIGGFATLIIAGSPPALVVDDFGQIAMAVEQDQKRDRRAAELGLVAQLRLMPAAEGGPERQIVTVELTGDMPPSLWLHLVHPTRADLDQHVALERNGNGWRALTARPPSRVYVQLTDADASWRLTGELHPGQQTLDLRAAPGR